MIGIVDYKCGNITSVLNALEFLGYEARLVNSEDELKSVNKVILPGVGAFDTAISSLNETGMARAISEWVNSSDNLLLGICLGMQLLCSKSEETIKGINGLGLIEAEAIILKSENVSILPNIGWLEADFVLPEMDDYSGDYYFVHSFGVQCSKKENVLCSSFYGETQFASGITNNVNIFGFQFHPEKSNVKGLSLIKWFCEK